MADICEMDVELRDESSLKGNSFKTVEIPSKGLSVVATRKIYPGELIMKEKPLIVVPNKIYENVEQVVKYLDKCVLRMSSGDRELFLGLSDCNSSNDSTYLGIFDTNDMDFGGDAGVFATMARVNHACCPNAEFVTDFEHQYQHLKAIECIDVGAEITINYLSMEEEGSDVKNARQKFLKDYYNFICSCEFCSQEVFFTILK